MKIFIIIPEGTPESEKIGMPGTNASFSVIRELKRLGFSVIGYEAAQLPNGAPLPLRRRDSILKKYQEADATLVMGSETARQIKSWFPLPEAVIVADPFSYMNDPARITLEIKEKLLESRREYTLNGFNNSTNMIGGFNE